MSNTTLKGTYRIVHVDANDNTIAELLEKHSSEFGDGPTPTSDAQQLPKVKKELSTILKEDDKLVIAFRPDETITEASAGMAHIKTYRIPVTFRNIRTGVVYEKTLVPFDFTSLRDPSASLKWEAGIRYNIDEYKIPAQSELKLGHKVQDVRVDSAINLHYVVVT